MKMTKKTANRLTQELIEELESHPHREEIISLVLAQLFDNDA